MKAFLGLVVAAALIAPGSMAPAQAAMTLAPGTSIANPTILVEGGCGRDYHRDERGYCRPNWREWGAGLARPVGILARKDDVAGRTIKATLSDQ